MVVTQSHDYQSRKSGFESICNQTDPLKGTSGSGLHTRFITTMKGRYFIPPPVIVNALIVVFQSGLRPTDWSSHCKCNIYRVKRLQPIPYLWYLYPIWGEGGKRDMALEMSIIQLLRLWRYSRDSGSSRRTILGGLSAFRLHGAIRTLRLWAKGTTDSCKTEFLGYSGIVERVSAVILALSAICLA